MTREKRKKNGKEPARRPGYGTFYCMKWLITRMWQWDKSLILSSVAILPLSVILYAINLYTPSIILDNLQKERDFNEIALVITALLGAGLLFKLADDFIFKMRCISMWAQKPISAFSG